MEEEDLQGNGYIQKSHREHRVLRPTQTGFSSPATHYAEPKIDLNEVLVTNPNSTFFMRVSDESFEMWDINEKDVLIIDKSLKPSKGKLALINCEGDFNLVKISDKSIVEIEIWGVVTYIIKAV